MLNAVEDIALEDRVFSPLEDPAFAGLVDDAVSRVELGDQRLDGLFGARPLGVEIGLCDFTVEFGGLAAGLAAGSGFAAYPGNVGAEVAASDVF